MRRAHPLIFLCVLASLFVAGFFLPVLAWVKAFSAWVQGAGWMGALAFFLLYVAATVLALPAIPLTLAAGVIYGPLLGTALVSPSSLVGAALAFLLGRTMLRGRVKARVDANPRLASVDRAVAQEGWRLVALLRLCPIFPFSLLNFALGTMDVGFGPYLLASWLAMLPITFLFVSAGSALGSLAGLGGKIALPAWMWGLFLGAFALVTWRVGLIARKALSTSLPGGGAAP